MARMKERIQLLKREVEGRGLMWPDDEGTRGNGLVDGDGERVVVNGVSESPATAGEEPDHNAQGEEASAAQDQPASSGRLTDEALQRMLAERMGEPQDEDEEGVHL